MEDHLCWAQGQPKSHAITCPTLEKNHPSPEPAVVPPPPPQFRLQHLPPSKGARERLRSPSLAPSHHASSPPSHSVHTFEGIFFLATWYAAPSFRWLPTCMAEGTSSDELRGSRDNKPHCMAAGMGEGCSMRSER